MASLEGKQAGALEPHNQAKSSAKEPSQLPKKSQEQGLTPTPKQGEQVAVAGGTMRTNQPTIAPEDQSRLSTEEESEAERRRRRREKRERKTGKEGSEKKQRYEEPDRSEPQADTGSQTRVVIFVSLATGGFGGPKDPKFQKIPPKIGGNRRGDF